MKIVAFTGLHGVGKSFIARILSKKTGAVYLNKRDLLKVIFGNYTDWENQYRKAYSSYGGYEITKIIFNLIVEKENSKPKLLIFDSVHNIDELQYIKKKYSSTLVLVTRPLINKNNLLLDNGIRLNSTHKINMGQVCDCLYVNCDWSICNTGSDDFLKKQIDELLSYIETR